MSVPPQPQTDGQGAAPYDGVVLLSFGGPEKPDDVMPFLENVTRGRGIPRSGWRPSPSTTTTSAAAAPSTTRTASCRPRSAPSSTPGARAPAAVGQPELAPYLTDALRAATAGGARRLCVIVTSAYSSYSGCRQYREDIAASLLELAAAGGPVPEVDKIRHYYNHPGFVAAASDAVRRALADLPEQARDGARLVFVTHSVPTAMNDVAGPAGDAYVRQHEDVSATVAAAVAGPDGGTPEWDLVYCSRSGPPSQPWLEPDVNDHLRALHAAGVPGVVVVPIGFVSDHMEVVYDLDTEARETAEELGLPFVRAATVGTDPRFVAGLVDLVLERAALARGESPDQPASGALGPSWAVCPVGCCRNLRADRPAACGADWPGAAAALTPVAAS